MLHSTQHSSFQWEALFSVLVLYDLQIHMSIILMYNGPLGEEFYSSEAERPTFFHSLKERLEMVDKSIIYYY